MPGGWYDRQGKPIDTSKAAKLFSSMGYKRVAETTVGEFWVSTVWLGLDHRHFGDGPPIIFETMVFGGEDYELTGYAQRYCTEEEARKGHESVVQKIINTPPPGKRVIEI